MGNGILQMYSVFDVQLISTFYFQLISTFYLAYGETASQTVMEHVFECYCKIIHTMVDHLEANCLRNWKMAVRFLSAQWLLNYCWRTSAIMCQSSHFTPVGCVIFSSVECRVQYNQLLQERTYSTDEKIMHPTEVKQLDWHITEEVLHRSWKCWTKWVNFRPVKQNFHQYAQYCFNQ